MNTKDIISAVSVILVVVVVFGVVVGFNKNHDGGSDELSAKMKAISSMCAPTDYRELCMQSLSKSAPDGTTDPKDLLKAAVQAILEQMNGSLNFSVSLIPKATNSTLKMSLEDCRDLHEYAIDDLQAALSYVEESNLLSMNDRVAEIQNWLSAVVSYHTACVEDISDLDHKSMVSNNILNATQLTGNALAMLENFDDILGSFHIKRTSRRFRKKRKRTSRRLFQLDDEKFPVWMSPKDRKLLGEIPAFHANPNAVVAKDGSGQYKSIAAALKAYPKGNKGRWVIYVKAGIYDEYITVDKDMNNIFMYGDGPRRTIVTGHKNFGLAGVPTWQTSTFSVIGEGFLCRGMGFQNTAGFEGHQAVALRVQGDRAAFFNCRMDGYQDTLYVQSKRQFFRNCVISGTVDFIFGDSATVIQNSLIIIRKGGPGQQNTVLAQGRQERAETTGIVLHNCKIVPEQKLFPERFTIKSYLGRSWKKYARTVVMETTIGDLIQPEGYMPWNGDELGYFAEYANRGPGARVDGRVKWKANRGLISRNEAMQFTPGMFLQGNQWLKFTGFPALMGLKN